MTADLDTRLRDAALAVRAAVDHDPVPAFEPPGAWPRVARIAVPSAVAASVAVGVALVATGGGGETRTGALPPSVVRGEHGTELALTEVDDGDGDPATVLLRVGDDGPEIRIGSADGVTATTFVTDTGVGATAVPTTAGDPGRCVDIASAGGYCGPDDEWMVSPGPRTPDGAVLVGGVPDDAVVVTFTSGDTRWWERPQQGLAAFPYTDAMPATVVVTALDGDGRVLAETATGDGRLTPAEVAALPRTTAPTGERLTTVWGLDDVVGEVLFGSLLRRDGVTGLAGYAGPIAIQVLPADPDHGTDDEREQVAVLSVPTARTDQVVGRVAHLDGAVAERVDHADGTTVLVWAGSAVGDARVDEIVAGLVPDPAWISTQSLDEVRSFSGIDQPVWPSDPLRTALLTDEEARVELDGGTVIIRVQRDDVGGRRFTYAGDPADGDAWAAATRGIVEAWPDPSLPLGLIPGGSVLGFELPAGVTADDVAARFDGRPVDVTVTTADGATIALAHLP